MKEFKIKQYISWIIVIAMALALMPTDVFSVETQGNWCVSAQSALPKKDAGQVLGAEQPAKDSANAKEIQQGAAVAADVSYKVTLHFVNNLGWETVNLFTWNDHCAPTGNWPGSGIPRGDNGFYTATFEYSAPADQPLNFIFNNGSVQTVDLTLPVAAFKKNADGIYAAEKWVLLTSANSEGKYSAEIKDSSVGLAVSPVISGQTVTFRYSAPSAKAVYVAGSFNGWNTTANKMVKGSDGVWSLTLSNLTPGSYEYKFVADGAWYTDPGNGRILNGNSAFLILDPNAKDTNTVNVVITYTRSDKNYENWNIAAWDAPNLKGQYDFAVNSGVAKTTITLSGRTTKTVGFKIRKSIGTNYWAEQSGEFRVNLGDMVSGTVYVNIANDFSSTQTIGADVVCANKITNVQLDYDNNALTVTTARTVDDPATAFQIRRNGKEESIIASVNSSVSSYTLRLTESLDLTTLYQYTVCLGADTAFADIGHSIGIDTVYASARFAEEFTYDGKDLGANWTEKATQFVLWAPTAEAVSVNIYTTGDRDADDLEVCLAMRPGEKGTWVLTAEGDFNGAYYTYSVTVNGNTVEAIDPYARTTGVNGERGMIIDLRATDPDAWHEITRQDSYTDAIIYELHIRDFSIDEDSGVSPANRGKFMAFTETNSAAMQHLTNLGITHVHLLPMYDYNSVDENYCGNFNWGYDPRNYNAPEGSYATDPYNGEVRVQEMKAMVNALHENGIGAIMDVVYNHVYDSASFSFNKIVPGYFSRPNSNTSGCGNDTASEREMVRKYIVDSVVYWAEEYHLDGFRFDLVGLLDVETINQIVTEVHKIRPDILFYGEGWDMDSTNKESGTEMAKQGNADKTPGFAYFSDSMRNSIGGSNGNSLGFAAGAGNGSAIVNEWLARPWWSSNPQQVVQYASCHDNYTLVDKLILSTNSVSLNDTIIRMNNLAAAYYLTAQGIALIHAGEEFLREKVEADGGRCENSYNASDAVNHLEWSNLQKAEYAATVEYYKGLIAFRKAHPALRYATADAVGTNVSVYTASDNLLVYLVDGNGSEAENSDILVIFNADSASASVNLPAGSWNVCVDDRNAGAQTLYTAKDTVQVAGISAMILVQEDTGRNETDTVTVYFSNNQFWTNVYAYYWGGNTSIQWPGQAMQWVKKNEYNEDVYCITIPSQATGILFHNNAGTQTVDILAPADGQGYYCTTQTNGKWNYGAYTYGQ